MSEYCLKLGLYLLHPFQFIIYFVNFHINQSYIACVPSNPNALIFTLLNPDLLNKPITAFLMASFWLRIAIAALLYPKLIWTNFSAFFRQCLRRACLHPLLFTWILCLSLGIPSSTGLGFMHSEPLVLLPSLRFQLLWCQTAILVPRGRGCSALYELLISLGISTRVTEDLKNPFS